MSSRASLDASASAAGLAPSAPLPHRPNSSNAALPLPATSPPGNIKSAAHDTSPAASSIPHPGQTEILARSIHRADWRAKKGGTEVPGAGTATEWSVFAPPAGAPRHVASMARLQDGEWCLPFGKAAETSLEIRPQR